VLEHLIHKVSSQWQNLEIIIDSPLVALFNQVYRLLKPTGIMKHKIVCTVASIRLTLTTSIPLLVTVNICKRSNTRQKRRPVVIIAASGTLRQKSRNKASKAAEENSSASGMPEIY